MISLYQNQRLLGRWEQLIKELVGIATYKVMGYI